jgi:D-alanyl-D-alanine carboxypeptidase
MRSLKFLPLISLLSIGFSLSIVPPTQAATVLEKSRSLHAELRPALDDRIKGIMERERIPGMAIVVMKNGLVIERRGYGLADRETQTTVGANTRFPIGSVTKQFTATAVMLLVEEGKLDLDQPIRQYLSDLPITWQPLTLRQLLAHTSGLSESINYRQINIAYRNAKGDRKVQNLPEIYQALNPKLDFPPGEAWMYSNTGYLVAGLIIEKVSGQSYHDFMRDRIFQPLGMNETQAELSNVPNLASGYYWNSRGWNRQLDKLDLAGWQWAHAAGNIISTATDMTKWAAALNAGKLLKPTSYEQLWSETRLNNGRATGYSYGLGWGVNRFNHHLTISHGGSISGYASGVARFPDDRLDVIVLTNNIEADGATIATQIAAIYDPTISIASLTPQPDPNPAFTQRFLAILQGKETNVVFAPEVQLTEQTIRGKYIKQFRTEYRTVQSLEFLREETQNGDRTYYYKTSLKGKVAYATISVTDKGNILRYGVIPSL